MTAIDIRNRFQLALSNDGKVDSAEAADISRIATEDNVVERAEIDELVKVAAKATPAARQIIEATTSVPLHAFDLADVRGAFTLPDGGSIVLQARSATGQQLSVFLDNGLGSPTRGLLFVGAPFPRRPMTESEARSALVSVRAKSTDPSDEFNYNPLIEALARHGKVDSATVNVESSLPVLSMLRGHGANLATIQRLPSGKLLTGDVSGVIKAWDERSQPVASMVGAMDYNVLREMPGGQVASAGGSGATIWDENGEVVFSLFMDRSGGSFVDIGASRFGTPLTLDAEGFVKHWVSTSAPTTLPFAGVTRIVPNTPGGHIVLQERQRVVVANVDGREEWSRDDLFDWEYADGKIFAALSTGGSVILDAATGAKLADAKGQFRERLPNGQLLFWGKDGELELRAQDGSPVKTLAGTAGKHFEVIGSSADGRVALTDHETVLLFDASGEQIAKLPNENSVQVSRVLFGAGNRYVLLSHDATARTYKDNVLTGTIRRTQSDFMAGASTPIAELLDDNKLVIGFPGYNTAQVVQMP